MASAGCRDSSMQDEALTKEEMQGLLAEFAKEAFSFLMHNFQIWIEFPKDFLTRHEDPGNSSVFTTSMQNAVITIAYLLRLELRKEFQNVIHCIKGPDTYEKYLRSYPIDNSKYFNNFLSWIAFVFDFTTYCWKNGYNYIERGEHCIASYSDLDSFNDNGGFYNLIEHSVHFSVIYDNLKSIRDKNFSQDHVISSFLKCVDYTERRNRYPNKWLVDYPKMQHVSEIKSKLSEKYCFVSGLDPRRVSFGCRVILKESPTKSPQKSSSKALNIEKTKCESGNTRIAVADLTSRMDKTASEEYSGDNDFPTSKESDDLKSVFIINKRFLNKSKKSSKDLKNKRGLKICPPSIESGILDMNLNRILDENIEKGNFLKNENGLYVVSPPGSAIDDDSTRIIVMDTSSEEEDCVPIPLEDFLSKIWSKHLNEVIEPEPDNCGSHLKGTGKTLSEHLKCLQS